MMFKCIITEHFGPFAGNGGYGSETKIGMSRSPKQAVAKAKSFRDCTLRLTNNENSETGIVGGGVPILLQFELYKNSELIASYVS